jgi:hypothetical protein
VARRWRDGTISMPSLRVRSRLAVAVVGGLPTLTRLFRELILAHGLGCNGKGNIPSAKLSLPIVSVVKK